jgi:predicted phage terminase large subunit-like protein
MKSWWLGLRFTTRAEEDETHHFNTPYGSRVARRKIGEALHPKREPLEILHQLRRQKGEYHFTAQYQQSPAPFGGGMIKIAWFKRYDEKELARDFDMVVQSWDTANKPGELNDYSVGTTWGVKDKKVYLLNVLRKRLDYPGLKRCVYEQARLFIPTHILIEDRASGTQLIQELQSECLYAVTPYEPKVDKTMRMGSASTMIENGFVSLPHEASW